jgi:5,10-methenyltetrahydromethanopterin hydrogenase
MVQAVLYKVGSIVQAVLYKGATADEHRQTAHDSAQVLYKVGSIVQAVVYKVGSMVQAVLYKVGSMVQAVLYKGAVWYRQYCTRGRYGTGSIVQGGDC